MLATINNTLCACLIRTSHALWRSEARTNDATRGRDGEIGVLPPGKCVPRCVRVQGVVGCTPDIRFSGYKTTQYLAYERVNDGQCKMVIELIIKKCVKFNVSDITSYKLVTVLYYCIYIINGYRTCDFLIKKFLSRRMRHARERERERRGTNFQGEASFIPTTYVLLYGLPSPTLIDPPPSCIILLWLMGGEGRQFLFASGRNFLSPRPQKDEWDLAISGPPRGEGGRRNKALYYYYSRTTTPFIRQSARLDLVCGLSRLSRSL